MRYLFIMKGCPGSGKTTFLKENNFEHMSLGFDQARSIFSGLYPTFDGESISLSSYGMKKCIDFVFSAMSERMDRGETLFFDATSLKQKDISRLANEGNRYGYTSYVIDMQKGISWEEIVERNNSRPVEDKVPEEKLSTMFELGKNSLNIPEVEILDKHSFWDVWNSINIKEVDGTKYDNIYIVGDIQSCSNALNKAISDNKALDDEKSLWIFAGDLFDRGPDAAGVFATIYPHIDNIILVEGNHETNMRRVISGTALSKMFKTTRVSQNQIFSSGYEKSDIKSLLRKAIPGVIINTQSKNVEKIIVTHGGIHHNVVSDISHAYKYYPAHSLITGTSERSYIYMGKCDYKMRDKELIVGAKYKNTLQVHGHRNIGDCITTIGSNTIINVENKVEFEGTLRVVHIDKDGDVTVKEYVEKDEEPSNTNDLESEKTKEYLSNLNNHPYIQRKEIEDNVYAYNFSREAFRRGIWDNTSITARGLIVKDNKVVARGFNKFFEYDDWSGHGFSLHDIYDTEKFSYPVKVQEKINGYLVLISVIDGELRLFSKSGITDYSHEAENILYSTIDFSGIQKLTKILQKHDITLACEAVTPLDPHIVNYYEASFLSPLACIKNDWEFFLDEIAYEKIKELFESNDGYIPQEKTVDTPQDLESLLKKEKQEKNKEGIIIIDKNKNMVKVKADYYKNLKRDRSNIRKLIQGKYGIEKIIDDNIKEKIKDTSIDLQKYLKQGICGEVLDIPELAKDISLYDN